VDGVYTMWSRPRGVPDLSYLEKLLLAVSVTQWQRLHGRAMLYCDSALALYLDRTCLLDLFDEVDTATVDRADMLDLNPSVFWSLARIVSLGAAEVPFVSLDGDLIVWRDFTDVFARSSVVVTHWESTDPSPWYPGPRELRTPPGYHWDTWALADSDAANVSLLYMGDERIRDSYIEEARRFVVGNRARVSPEAGVAPELLFAEQRLLSLIARRDSVPITPLIDAVWSPALDRFATNDPEIGTWDPLLTGQQQTAGVTHAWFHKAVLPPDHPRLRRLESELAAILRETRPAALPRIMDIRPEP
jgi:hypothetical protein